MSTPGWRPGAAMPRRILILGGPRSGTAMVTDPLVRSLADTGNARLVTVDVADRPQALLELLGTTATGDVLVADVAGWLRALHTSTAPGAELDETISALADAVRDTAATVVLTSPEIGLGVPVGAGGGTPGGHPPDATGGHPPDAANGYPLGVPNGYPLDALGRVNTLLAGVCDAVALVVAGQPLWIKPATTRWPGVGAAPRRDGSAAARGTTAGRPAPGADGPLRIRPGMHLPLPDEEAREGLRTRLATLDLPGRGLGVLADVVEFAAGVQGTDRPHPFEAPHLLLLASEQPGPLADGIDPEAARRWIIRTRRGEGALALLAAAAGVPVDVVDVPGTARVNAVREPAGDAPGSDPAGDAPGDAPDTVDTSGTVDMPDMVDSASVESTPDSADGPDTVDSTFLDAMSDDELTAAFDAGVRLADRAADSGVELLILAAAGAGVDAAATAVIAALTGAEAAGLLPRVIAGTGTGRRYDHEAWMRESVAVRDALYRLRGRESDTRTVLRTVGGPVIATATGVLLGAAARRTAVLLDGPAGVAAALAARDVAAQVRHWLLLPDHGDAPAVRQGAEVLDLTPFLDLRAGLGEGTLSLAALPMIQSALALAALDDDSAISTDTDTDTDSAISIDIDSDTDSGTDGGTGTGTRDTTVGG